MYHPTTRLLTILELLQTYAVLSGAELARRLEVEPRSVRRYILMLQDMGLPIESVRGPGGGYCLRPGFKLPPLMLTEEEATAVVLGLLGSAWLEIEQSTVAVEGALAKISRVLPLRARERLHAVSSNLTLSAPGKTVPPRAALLLDLSEAIQYHQRVALDYRSTQGAVTQRTVEPYGITGWQGHWYLVGYCCLRRDYRVFRLDRIHHMALLDERFEANEGFDYRVYMQERHASTAADWQIEVELYIPLPSAQEKIPASYGTLTATPNGVLFQCQYADLPGLARYLMALDVPFAILQPAELRAALLQLSEQMRQIATTHS